MQYLDSWILGLTERICRRFQQLTGKTNVWLAVQLTNLSIVIYFVWAAVYAWNVSMTARVLAAFFCAGLLYALTQTIFKVPVEVYEDHAYRRLAKGVRNPRRVRDALLRISFLTLSIVLAYPMILAYVALQVRLALLTYSLILLTTTVLYLLACDPLPPCPGKLREWLRGAAPAQLSTSRSSADLRLREASRYLHHAILTQEERRGRELFNREYGSKGAKDFLRSFTTNDCS